MSTILACSLTPRLCLTPLTLNDVPAFRPLGADDEVFRYNPGISVPFDADAWVERTLSGPENYICHVVRLRPSCEAIGYVQISLRENLELELGYWLGRQYWGNPYAQESTASALLLFRAIVGTCRIFAAPDLQNTPSLMVLTKLGFKRRETSSPETLGTRMIDHVLCLP